MSGRRGVQMEGADESFEITFISLMLLLFCFMVIMVSLAQIEEPRFRKAIGSVRGAFSLLNEAERSSQVSDDGPGVLPHRREKPSADDLEDLRLTLTALLPDADKHLVTIEYREGGTSLTLGNVMLFDPGMATLRQDAAPLLDAVADFLREWEGRARILGHTCDIPIETPRYPSNWDLSMARAVEFVRGLESRGVAGDRLLAVGMGATRPAASNATTEGRELNRRVEVVMEFGVSP